MGPDNGPMVEHTQRKTEMSKRTSQILFIIALVASGMSVALFSQDSFYTGFVSGVLNGYAIVLIADLIGWWDRW